MIANDTATRRELETRTSHRAPFRLEQRRLLCATDLTSRSEHALRAAVKLSGRLDAQLILLHVLPTREANESARLRTLDRLREQLSAAGLSPNSVPALVVREGETARTIAAVARETSADLIVLGAQRKRALAALTGTTAERVVASARRPVLIVRSKGALSYGRVVVAADLGSTFRYVLRFADGWSFFDRAPISIVHGFQSPYQGPLYAEGYDVATAQRYTARWKKVAHAHLLAEVSGAGLDASRFDLRIEEKRPLRVVRRSLGYGKPALLVLGSSGHTFMTRMFRGSLANDALLSLDCDVLICAADAPRWMLH